MTNVKAEKKSKHKWKSKSVAYRNAVFNLIDSMFLQTAPSSVMLRRRRVSPITEFDPVIK